MPSPNYGPRRVAQERLGQLLWEEAETPQPSAASTALRMDGWVYGGPFDAEAVVDAVCAALVPRPAACFGEGGVRGSALLSAHVLVLVRNDP